MISRRFRGLGPSARTSPLRVVVVEPTLVDNGAIRVSLDRAARWHTAGVSVTVFVLEQAPLGLQTVEVPDGLEVQWATPVPRRLRWTLLVGLPRLWRSARQADVVVAGREIGLGLLTARLIAPLARRPVSVTVQSRPDLALTGYIPPRMREISRRALVTADQAVCVAGGIVPVLTGMGLPEDRAEVVTNGVDVEAIQAAAQQPWPLSDVDGPVLVGLGRLAHQKGFDLLVRAHAEALAAGAPAHTVVVMGEGPDLQALQQLAKDLGVQDSVRFPGHVDNPHAVLARAAAFILPSRWEGYPLALVEALCCGTPSIAASCVSGPAEVLDGGAFGRLVPVEDPSALATAIVDHLQDTDALLALARAGRLAAPDRFAADVAARRHLDLLLGLVDSRGRPSGTPERAARKKPGSTASP